MLCYLRHGIRGSKGHVLQPSPLVSAKVTFTSLLNLLSQGSMKSRFWVTYIKCPVSKEPLFPYYISTEAKWLALLKYFLFLLFPCSLILPKRRWRTYLLGELVIGKNPLCHGYQKVVTGLQRQGSWTCSMLFLPLGSLWASSLNFSVSACKEG